MGRGSIGAALTGGALVGLAACGPNEGSFVSNYVLAYCEYYLACSDPALAVFDGIDTVEECQDVEGPPVVDASILCKLDREMADMCLAGLDGLACTGDPADVDASLPDACGMVWQQCEEAG